jgi:hypothetical protein
MAGETGTKANVGGGGLDSRSAGEILWHVVVLTVENSSVFLSGHTLLQLRR